MKISKKYKKISDAYLYFAKDFIDSSDTSDKAMIDMYSFETFGHPKIKYSELQSNGTYNAYAIGKHWMDVTLSMWKEDLKSGIITKNELYMDDEIPSFVKSIIEKL